MNQIGKLADWIGSRFRLTGSDVWTPRILGRWLRILEVERPAVQAERKPPLLIGLHGMGSNELQLKTLVGLQLDEPFVYIAPRAPQKHPTGGFTWFPVSFAHGNYKPIGVDFRQVWIWLLR